MGLLLIDKDLIINDVFINGKCRIKNKQIIIKGTYE